MTTSPVLWTSSDADAATDGASTRTWQASGVSIDTRTLAGGDLFVALQGPNFDGHDFAAAALGAGACAVVASRVVSDWPDGTAVLRVGNTLEALEALGCESRSRMRGKVIAVTGSVGKTSTKEMLKSALAGQGNISASAGNLNNHWGLPLSLSRMPSDTDFGVFELGMNHPEEIRPLGKMAKPHVAIITAIEAAHAEYFNSIDEIAEAKAEIFDGLVDGGYAVLNQDSDYFDFLSALAKKTGNKTVCGFGYHEDAWARILNVRLHGNRSDVTASVNGVECKYTINAPGEHLVKNSAAVLAAVFLAGGKVETAAIHLGDFQALKGRGNRTEVDFPAGSFTLVDESYNASPASMRAALDVARRIKVTGQGRRIAVLGDMLELGQGSAEAHADLLHALQENSFDLVFTAGPLMQNLWDVLPGELRGGHSISPEKLALVVTSAIRSDDVIVIKGSLGSRVGKIVEALSAMDTNQSICIGV